MNADDYIREAARLLGAGDASGGLAACESALALAPDNATALNFQGVALRRLGREADAETSYRRAIAVQPAYPEAWFNLANMLAVSARQAEALASYNEALRQRQDFQAALFARGRLLANLTRFAEAARDFETLLALAPEHTLALGELLAARGQICDWRDRDALLAQLVAYWRAGKRKLTPFESLLWLDDAEAQLQCARQHVRDNAPPIAEPRAPARAYDKIRLGYLSPDFRDHAVALLSAGLFEQHDRAKFEVHAFSCGPKSDDWMRKRLITAFDSFTELDGATPSAIAEKMRARGLDVAVDMGGYTRAGAPFALAHRPAAIQASYLGYPGTLGAPFIDYLIADNFLIPPEAARHYSEKIVRLPVTYQPNSTRPLRAATRAEHDLPEHAIVLCALHAPAKITPTMFAVWMRIVAACENAMLWLHGAGAVADNLKREAARAGIAPERLIFTGFLPWEQHLARLALADLVLDTAPYGAHTTASDALWVDVPIVTCTGQTFASRVPGSLLTAAGLPELIAPNIDSYVDLAVDLARQSEKLRALKSKLSMTRNESPLFDIAAYTRALERAYDQMIAIAREGAAPQDINIS